MAGQNKDGGADAGASRDGAEDAANQAPQRNLGGALTSALQTWDEEHLSSAVVRQNG